MAWRLSAEWRDRLSGGRVAVMQQQIDDSPNAGLNLSCASRRAGSDVIEDRTQVGECRPGRSGASQPVLGPHGAYLCLGGEITATGGRLGRLDSFLLLG